MRYDVTRYDGTKGEVIRDLDLYTARRIVDRDQATGTQARMEPRTTVRVSGRQVIR